MRPDYTEMSYEKIFGNNVKACREARGLSQKELAEDILGYPEEMIRQAEEGKALNCSIDFYVCLAKTFGVTLDALLTNRYLVPRKVKEG